MTKPQSAAVILAQLEAMADYSRAVLSAAGADAATAEAATRAMLHASRLGVDSHGIRLLDHYVTVIEHGRVNGCPDMRFSGEGGAVAVLDADNAHGARATYHAMDKATALADRFGIGAVSIRNSSHFGAAGAYALEAAERGFIGLAVCNSDSFVRLHDGAMRFHGTNPIAFGVPVAGTEPWLLDMATSAIPYNRVKLYESLGVSLPDGVASDAQGHDTIEPRKADMLAPLGGAFGFKGAALAGLVEILSAVLSGMKLSFDILPMGGPDLSTPRGLGAFVLALKPTAFLDEATFDAGMTHYLKSLRQSPVRADAGAETHVMAPGDREWQVAEARERDGIPLDPATQEAFRRFAVAYGIALPFANQA
ncbi:LDH2 family malate/lactate/ureidoglycolate dehydrogenase [Neorhizobium galegae]|uniref:Ldh family oxidoreductase n=1 Tax=Neorhizobium galegae TaxID=399 RepID=UPI001AE3616D|nr:Ldh family oxidoreductase [Neorhizobium galegae]MBP2548522.1 LDH2 family malate/lactate/ureidoglycolate dehydrogenase [Neorhizobium galegae]